MDKNLQELLKWSIENQDTSGSGQTGPHAPPGEQGPRLAPDAMASLFGGGPSDADLMRASMDAIQDPEVSHDDKLVAFDNFEQLIENLDNANNIANLSLWTPLLAQLDAEHPDIRRMAAWCVGTAVQNNQPTQERLLAMGGLPILVRRAAGADEKDAKVRRKATYALSSAVRNYQPAMDVFVEELGKLGKGPAAGVDAAKIKADDMDAVDEVINGIRDQIPKE